MKRPLPPLEVVHTSGTPAICCSIADLCAPSDDDKHNPVFALFSNLETSLAQVIKLEFL
jgi:hypothetical protein